MLFKFTVIQNTVMIKKNITVPKTARYFVQGKAGEQVKTVWFVCHGYGQAADYFLKNFKSLENEHSLIVAPEGLHRFYWEKFSGRVVASWMTKEDREDDINDYVLYLDKVYEEVMQGLPADVNITALGFSQGTSTVCRWIANRKSIFHNLILWAGSLPPDVDLSAAPFPQFKIQYVAGDMDVFMNEEQIIEVEQLLKSKNLDFELIRFSGKHELNEPVLLKLAKKTSVF